MEPTLAAVVLTAALVGIAHVLVGPDHYVPFVALSRVRGWSLGRTLGVTTSCGIAHVGASVAIGVGLVGAGRTVLDVARIESLRGGAAAWLLLGFGATYLVWGVRRGMRGAGRSASAVSASSSTAACILFLVFVLGPCEPLIPLVVVPAAQGSSAMLALTAATFASATLATMVGMVTVGWWGAERIRSGAWLTRWSHAMAGAMVAACGLAMHAGM